MKNPDRRISDIRGGESIGEDPSKTDKRYPNEQAEQITSRVLQ